MLRESIVVMTGVALATMASAAEFHVAVTGNDTDPGTKRAPFRTIQRAADLAQPGDTITVHEGTYREWVKPPRGGESDARRIVYQAAPGEKVEIKGSEVVRGWKPLGPGTWQGVRYIEDAGSAGSDGKQNKAPAGMWKAVIPNSFFGGYNPYKDVIAGDWIMNPNKRHTGEVYLDGKSLYEAQPNSVFNNTWSPFPSMVIGGTAPGPARDPEGAKYRWYCESDDTNTTIYANFRDKNPNERLVEINVRRAVFYPERPGINYLTVRGFTMRHAATQWAPPTAEQVGLIGTHWSKGWIIENNIISDSRCAGVTLGKYGDEWDNKSANSAAGYSETIERALKNGWNKETIGHHIVRDNTISDCDQAGICGSLGAIFSEISGNHIYNIHAKRQIGGYEMAGIKFHGAIDTVIKNNRIHNAYFGLWLDWMTQGTRITGNLCYDNSDYDLVVEMNHGPFLVDNNVFLSDACILDQSQGGAYAHNLMAGKIDSHPDGSRTTPYLKPHSTELGGRGGGPAGDNRFFNNIFVGSSPLTTAEVAPADANTTAMSRARGFGLWVYDARRTGLKTGGNVYYYGTRPYAQETNALVLPGSHPVPRLEETGGRVLLLLSLGPDLKRADTGFVTTELLGKTAVSGLPYENPDGSPLRIDTDYFGKPRSAAKPAAGPFEQAGQGELRLTAWPSRQEVSP